MALAGWSTLLFLLFVVLRLFRRRPPARPTSSWPAAASPCPRFVASLVTTWYGGILGVGEYSW